MSEVHAADLIAQARAATTDAELDAIEAQAAGRVTVEEAVDARRAELVAGSQSMPEAPIVDPSPTAAPIMAGANEYVFPPAAASPQEVLDLKPNRAADATSGPDAQISPSLYVRMSRPDGGEFLAPKANVEHYESKGFVAGAEVEIEDIGAYWAEQAKAS